MKNNRHSFRRPSILELTVVYSFTIILSIIVGGMIAVAIYAI